MTDGAIVLVMLGAVACFFIGVMVGCYACDVDESERERKRFMDDQKRWGKW